MNDAEWACLRAKSTIMALKHVGVFYLLEILQRVQACRLARDGADGVSLLLLRSALANPHDHRVTLVQLVLLLLREVGNTMTPFYQPVAFGALIKAFQDHTDTLRPSFEHPDIASPDPRRRQTAASAALRTLGTCLVRQHEAGVLPVLSQMASAEEHVTKLLQNVAAAVHQLRQQVAAMMTNARIDKVTGVHLVKLTVSLGIDAAVQEGGALQYLRDTLQASDEPFADIADHLFPELLTKT